MNLILLKAYNEKGVLVECWPYTSLGQALANYEWFVARHSWRPNVKFRIVSK